MILIPCCNYLMGKNMQERADFSPQHQVKISSFYIDQFEVTNKEYFDFCQSTGHSLPEFWNLSGFRNGLKYPDHPVVGISWIDANEYAKWAGKRLPTEAEWECAARGGKAEKDFPDGSLFNPEKEGINYGQSAKGTIKVGCYNPNSYGLYDMAGNVWEWVADWYSQSYYQRSSFNDPKGPKKGRFRVIRGGSWHSGAYCTQVHYRNALPANWVDFAVGFRCAKNYK